MKGLPVTSKAYQLFHEGCVALSQVEANGIRIDVDYLNRAIEFTTNQIVDIEERLKQGGEIYRAWRKVYGKKTNLGSREQLGKVLFDTLGYECKALTDKGRYKTDEAALEGLDLPFVRNFIKVEKLKKARSTYLRGILREVGPDGYLHPFFNLNLVATYRSSSDHINFQNIPMKNPSIKKLVRRAFISRPDYRLVEIDYSKAEVCCATCYHRDPNMIRYLKDPTKDMHRDAACDCYLIPPDEVSWDARDTGKNMFVFPEFYGDYYIHCARMMWEACQRRKIKTNSGTLILRHLRNQGIKRLGACSPKCPPITGTFENHIRKVEKKFWQERFQVYGEWRDDWYADYVERGWFETLTGFRIEGILKRNEVINYPVQGSAFHWLLWSLIRIQNILNKYNMRSLIVGQIHDSIVADVYHKELNNFLEICNQVMTIDIVKHWPWIIVPLVIEAEASPIGGNWDDKKEVKIA